MAEVIDFQVYRDALVPPAHNTPLAFTLYRYANSEGDGTELIEDDTTEGFGMTPGERMRCYAEHLLHSTANLLARAHSEDPNEMGQPLALVSIHQHAVRVKILRPALLDTSMAQIEKLAYQIHTLMQEAKAGAL